jgi:uncharacterized protein YbjQ (UPF0145 family)
MENQSQDQEQQKTKGSVFSGLNANEMYCLKLIGLEPDDLVIGNSVYSLGVIGGLKSSIRTVVGGEIKSITEIILQGRKLAFQRLIAEVEATNGFGVSGLTSELVFQPSQNIEFLSVGSAVQPGQGLTLKPFTTSFDGQELYCAVDAGYEPISFVFGNVAYSIGITKGILGGFRSLARGEVSQYSGIFNDTRKLALQRIIDEAKSVGANAVVGIRTEILPFGLSGVQEMVMVGTAAQHPDAGGAIPGIEVTTSDLTAEETWNLTKMGYMPMQLVLGTSVYSLGVVGGLMAGLKNLVKGEIKELTHMIYGAREESLKKLQQQASEIGAEDVLGIKTYVYNLGNGLIEFLAIGTAVKKVPGLDTRSEQLPPQAIIVDKDTFVNSAERAFGVNLSGQSI